MIEQELPDQFGFDGLLRTFTETLAWEFFDNGIQDPNLYLLTQRIITSKKPNFDDYQEFRKAVAPNSDISCSFLPNGSHRIRLLPRNPKLFNAYGEGAWTEDRSWKEKPWAYG